jgi:hypothetical protein|tara:strand:- start:36 stop:299 length:264 start_codon:yes stop_codon:yes gene_type:complete
MILTETNTGRFLCVVNSTLERFIESINIDNIEMLSAIIPNIKDIDPYNAFSVDLRKIRGKQSEWIVEINGDNGIVEMTLTKHFLQFD